ncbi:MAG: hypothetical protein J7641_19280 [Cyanobacteria bacterium SID2]|nr:hypothetical protein [Cyanobacteria bacterium SID2]MBP0003251.1 hypothetical protein [Cyanobacteria bacterium SBC]
MSRCPVSPGFTTSPVGGFRDDGTGDRCTVGLATIESIEVDRTVFAEGVSSTGKLSPSRDRATSASRIRRANTRGGDSEAGCTEEGRSRNLAVNG